MIRDNRKHGGTIADVKPLLFRRDVAVPLRVTLTVLTAFLETAALQIVSIGGENQITIADPHGAGGPNIARCAKHLSHKIR